MHTDAVTRSWFGSPKFCLQTRGSDSGCEVITSGMRAGASVAKVRMSQLVPVREAQPRRTEALSGLEDAILPD